MQKNKTFYVPESKLMVSPSLSYTSTKVSDELMTF